MGNRERLYEVFAKVNNLSEGVYDEVFNTEEMDELHDDIQYAVDSHFRMGGPKMFAEGVPSQININIKGKQIPFVMDEQNGLEDEESAKDQLNYTGNYTAQLDPIDQRLRNVVGELFIPITVEVEKNYMGNKIDFYTRTWLDHNNVNLQFDQKR